MPLQGMPRPLFGRFKFLVRDLSGLIVESAFNTCEGLKYNIEKIEYREGGALVPYTEPGLVTFDDLVLARGVSYSPDFYNWCLAVVDVESYLPGGAGEKSPAFKRDLNVWQLERNNEKSIQYNVYWAFPIAFDAGNFDNNASELSMETLTLSYHHFIRKNLLVPVPAVYA